jgi:hypothetical protein
MDIKIAKVIDPYTVVLNKGKTSGIVEGQRLVIYRLDDEIVDPDSNEPLGKLEIIKGTGRVVHLQEKMCTLSSDMRGSSSKTIRKKPGIGLGLGLPSLVYAQEEEVSPPEKVPFSDPEVGDWAKPV